MSIYDPIFYLLDNGSLVFAEGGIAIIVVLCLYTTTGLNLLWFILTSSFNLLLKLFKVIKSKISKSKEKEGAD